MCLSRRRAGEFQQKSFYQDEYVSLSSSEKSRPDWLNIQSLKTLGRGIPKIVSLFEPVKLLVANTDKHELCQSDELPDMEFDGLDDEEVAQLKRG